MSTSTGYGKKIAVTPSGRSVYENKRAHEYHNFTEEDHKDAAWHHYNLAKTGDGKLGTAKKKRQHAAIAEGHSKAALGIE